MKIRLKFLIIAIGFALLSGCGGSELENASKIDDKTTQESSSDVIALKTEVEFLTILSENDIVLVDFHADWCPPCTVLKPTIARIAEKYSEKITVVAVDIDMFEKLASGFNIRSIPTVNIFYSNKLEASLAGVRPMGEYTHIIDRLLSDKH